MNIDMRKIIFIGMIIGIFISACEKDDSYLELSETEIQLDAAGAEQYIQVNTNAITWQISSSSDWVIAERDSCFLVIKAGSNQVRSERNAKVVIVADNKYVRINISQAASTRAVGEPYPDETNPIGIIYKVLDGGKHGKILSLDEFNGKWGLDSNTGIRSLEDGKSNTRDMINAYKDAATFDSDYSIFWWIYQEKNNGDIDGQWYIPAYSELVELYLILVGQSKTTTTDATQTVSVSHNINVRNQFDYQLKLYGGVPMDYEEGYYWSSTEYNTSNARRGLFKHRTSTNNYTTKKSSFNVRAILQF